MDKAGELRELLEQVQAGKLTIDEALASLSPTVAELGFANVDMHLPMRHGERYADADVIVVVAGMDGALPSDVGGLVDCPVIAVQTSVGYGAASAGVAPLLTMLNSCAANVVVVNIDRGFKGGYVAGLMARRRHVGQDSNPAK